MAELDPALEAATRNQWGDRRFYPPGQHPATLRLRRHRELLALLPENADRDLMLERADAELARFEEGESIAKADYLRMLER